MTYVTVKEHTEELLHFTRQPSIKAWALLGALVSLGLWSALYSVDHILMKIAIFLGATFVGVTCMEEWEDCLIDKKKKKISFIKQSLIQKILQSGDNIPLVTADMEECIGVQVRDVDVKYGATGHLVEILFASGYSIGVTETATLGDKSSHEQTAELIRSFLNIERMDYPDPSDDLDTCSTSSGESFEHVDKADLVDDKSQEKKPATPEVLNYDDR